VKPPHPGLRWTPPYWNRVDGGYIFHAGYRTGRVGFYGGINYGYGYSGNGYQDAFFYSRAVNNLGSINVAHVYDKAVTEDENGSRVSFNGGSRGTRARPTPQQEALNNEQHVKPTAEQQQHFKWRREIGRYIPT
jgi:hypothetical protein